MGRYSKEFRERAVRLATEAMDKHSSRWAALESIAKKLELDVTKCESCGGRLRIVETVRSDKRLTELREEARGPPRPRPAVVGQLELCW